MKVIEIPPTHDTVKAKVSKRFFTEIITRDISLEDSILDLIDNSIDSVIRNQKIDIEEAIFKPKKLKNRKFINISISSNKFEISDNTGGISRDEAETDVFIFGAKEKPVVSYLSVYGIGLKRAIFKIGKKIKINSKTLKDGWEVTIDVEKWMREEDNWTFNIEEREKAKNLGEAGVTITIEELKNETKRRIRESSFHKHLKNEISTVYAVFLGNYVDVFVEGEKIHGIDIPLTAPEGGSIQEDTFFDSGITVKVAVGAQARNVKGEWEQRLAGWYILCNGRVVVDADKTTLTFWAMPKSGGLPLFVPKFSGFVGVVLFLSKDPELLPWTTTKRNLDKDSLQYQRAKSRMVLAARPILSILSKHYEKEKNRKGLDKESTKPAIETQKRPLTLKELGLERTSTFKYDPKPLEEFAYLKIEYEVTQGTFEKAKKLSKQNLSPNELGLFTFKYFLKNEG